MKNILTIRARKEPWITYDLNTLFHGCFPSREKDYIKKYVETWNSVFTVSYFEARDRLREISLENFSKVENVDEIVYVRPREDRYFLSQFDGFVLSTDDDDFFAPWIFDEVPKMINGKNCSFFWKAYCSGHMSRTVLSAGSLKEEIRAHTNNIMYDCTLDKIKGKKQGQWKREAKRHKYNNTVETTLSFYNCHPWGKSAIRRMIVDKQNFWMKFTLGEKQLYMMIRYLQKAEKSLEVLSDKVWFKAYWSKVINLAKESVGKKRDYDFPDVGVMRDV